MTKLLLYSRHPSTPLRMTAALVEVGSYNPESDILIMLMPIPGVLITTSGV